ncbi:hypothetical protein RND81_07G177500 [Saponaria officinalis]|uniref:non-specific serine/threonine protein kinase n=1 Tax=Saponaria officinalis TaxID=3572 RepID=A0AAW1JUS5_SAPOF
MHNLYLIRNPNLKQPSSKMVFWVLIFLGFFSFEVNCKPFSEKEILLKFKSSISDPSGVLSTWVAKNDSSYSEHCSWNGVVCDGKFRVSELKIIGGGNGVDKGVCFNVSELPLYGFGIRRICDAKNGKLIGGFPNVVAKLRKIRVLSLPFHEFSGDIPKEIWDLQDLEVIDLEGNLLSGNLPVEFNGLRKLRVLNLGLNRIGGEIPSSLSRAVGLEMMNLGGNELEGLIPEFVGNFPKLWGLYLSLNRLKGEIPDVWGKNCRNLRFLDLSGNALNGRIPDTLGECRDLRALLLYSNTLQGCIPREVGLLRKLKVLDVSRNRLGGYIPSELKNCRHLSVLVLSNVDDPYLVTGKSIVVSGFKEGNRFQGSIPMQLKALTKLSIVWTLKSNDALEMINLSPNLVIREGNGVFDSCKSGTRLDLSLNKRGVRRFAFSACDSLHSCISKISQLNKASVGYRLFFIAKVCQGASSMPSNARLLSEFNSTSDETMPSSTMQSSAEDLQADAEPPSADDYGNKFNSIEIASIVSASVIVLVLLALVVLFIYTRKCAPRDNSRVQVYERREIRVFTDIGVPLTFQNVVKATDCFSSSNCIGCGGFGATYKAEISQGVIVAVKRLAVGRFHCIQQFHAEIKTLGRIRHPNLVTLIGYHASETEMFLIYNYLPGGNLEKFIQERSTKAIKWKGIHKIALDVAHAIAYLHDECNPRVIHRDVKPSNILLDNDYNAYLSDFGLSRLLENSETHATTGVAGTFGYLAPEYAMTCRVSEKADVYSYGVVLLELISDKKALDPSFSSHGNGFNIVSWAHMLLRQGRAKEVFTAGIWESGPHDDLVDVLHLAVKCTVDSLTIRPTMKQVVQLLKQFRPL